MRLQPPPEDFIDGFKLRFHPNDIGALIRIIDFGARRSADLLSVEFPAGNYAIEQGMMRRRYIEDRCRSTQFQGGIVAEARDFKGHLLDGDERRHNFTFLTSREVGAFIYRASPTRPIPKSQPPIRRYLNALPFGEIPLYPSYMLRLDLLPKNLKALYAIRYWLDPDDSTFGTVGDVECIVLSRDLKSIYCHVFDLRAYATWATQEATDFDLDQDLPISLNEEYVFDPETPEVPDEQPSDGDTEYGGSDAEDDLN